MPSLILQLFFWFAVLGLAHTYVIYPIAIRLLARLKTTERRQFTQQDPDHEWPRLIVLIAAHNEEAVIGATLDSIFSAEYPTDRFQVIIGSDDATDRTNEIIEGFQKSHSNLSLRKFTGRNGKIRVINQLVSETRSQSTVFDDSVAILCDANVLWSNALPRHLARHFKDPQVGQVASNVRDERDLRRGIGDEEQAYVNHENLVKHAEGQLFGRMMGAFGACFAMRAKLLTHVPEHYNVDDFFHTIQTFSEGYDAIADPKAVCYEDVSEKISEEFRRKKRISTGNFQNLKHFFHFLMPWKGGLTTSLVFWSHKGLRWFGPLLIIAAFVTSALLALDSSLYLLALVAQLSGYAFAVIDGWMDRAGRSGPRLFRYLRYFLVMNLALLAGGIRFLIGVDNSIWEPTQRVVSEPESTLS